MSTSKNCPNCGMSLKRGEKGGGTNAGRSKSTRYYSHCYQSGQFTSPNITVETLNKSIPALMCLIRGKPSLARRTSEVVRRLPVKQMQQQAPQKVIEYGVPGFLHRLFYPQTSQVEALATSWKGELKDVLFGSRA